MHPTQHITNPVATVLLIAFAGQLPAARKTIALQGVDVVGRKTATTTTRHEHAPSNCLPSSHGHGGPQCDSRCASSSWEKHRTCPNQSSKQTRLATLRNQPVACAWCCIAQPHTNRPHALLHALPHLGLPKYSINGYQMNTNRILLYSTCCATSSPTEPNRNDV